MGFLLLIHVLLCTPLGVRHAADGRSRKNCSGRARVWENRSYIRWRGDGLLTQPLTLRFHLLPLHDYRGNVGPGWQVRGKCLRAVRVSASRSTLPQSSRMVTSASSLPVWLRSDLWSAALLCFVPAAVSGGDPAAGSGWLTSGCRSRPFACCSCCCPKCQHLHLGRDGRKEISSALLGPRIDPKI